MLIVISSLSAFSQQSLWVGQSYRLDVTSSVMGMTYNMSWSTNGGYLSLSGAGFYRDITVTQYFSGTAYVTCEWDYKLTSSSRLTHVKRQVAITCRDNQVSISPTSMTMSPGESRYVSYRHQHDNQYTSAANAYFQSSDPSICTVSSSGEVVAKTPGTTYINVYSKVSSISPYCKVTVRKIDPTSVSLPSSITMTAGESRTITPTLYPSNAQTTFSWFSSDPQVASVSEGVITAKKHGIATITVKTANGLSAVSSVKINKAKLKITSSHTDGLYKKGSIVTLSANDNNAIIHYTLDGSIPDKNSPVYNKGIELSTSCVLQAIALHDDYIDSDMLTCHLNVSDLDIKFISENSTGLSSITFPFIQFNYNISSKFDANKIKINKDGNDIQFEVFINGNIVFFVPDANIYSQGGNYSVSIEESCFSSIEGDPNLSVSFNVNVFPSSERLSTYPIKSYAGEYASAYILNDNSLKTFGGWPSEAGWTYPKEYTFYNVLSSCESESIFAYVDINNNLWVAGYDSWFFPFKEAPILYKEGVTEVAYSDESTLYYLTIDGELYGIGSDRFKQLLGRGNKSRYGVYYADSPIHLMDNVKHVYANDRNCAVIMNDNSLLMWGEYDFSKHKVLSTPYKVADNVIHASIGRSEPVTYIREDGSAWFVDLNLQTHKIADNIKYIFGSYERGYYITQKNELYGWGRNDHGQLGDGSISEYPYLLPTQAKHIMNNVTDISCRWNYTMAITTDSHIYGWGQNGCYRFSMQYDTDYNQTTPLELFVPDINPNIEDIALPKSLTCYVNKTTIIPRYAIPLNGICNFIEWKSSNPAIAEVNNCGMVTPKDEGECVVTVLIENYDGYKISKDIDITILPQEANVNELEYDFTNEMVTVYSINGIVLYQGLYKDIPALLKGLYILRHKDISRKIIF